MTEVIDGLVVQRRGSALVLTMTNPGRRNAFYPEMRGRIAEAIAAAASDPAVRAIILTGAEGHFCSGADLRRVSDADNGPLAVRERLKSVHRLLELIIGGAKPTIAAVEGDAFGAGMSMAVAADVVVVARGARFGASFAKIGLLPDMGLLYTLPLRVGLARARRLMMTARTIDAEEAVAIGLGDELTAEGAALDRALEVAAEFEASAPLSLAAIKAAMAQGLTGLDDVTRFELNTVPGLANTEDHLAARKAFLAKETVVFVGR